MGSLPRLPILPKVIVNNPWELYTSNPAWQAVADRLDASSATALAGMDARIAGGGAPDSEARVAFAEVLAVMDAPECRPFVSGGFGAGDSEPREQLASRIAARLNTCHRRGEARFEVSRWGDVW